MKSFTLTIIISIVLSIYRFILEVCQGNLMSNAEQQHGAAIAQEDRTCEVGHFVNYFNCSVNIPSDFASNEN